MIQEANLHWRYLDGEIILPWYTLPCLKWLKSIDTSKWNVFEYGAGYSTIWWRLNALTVTSVDNNESWAKAMGANHVTEQNNYINSIQKHIPFDCVIVDGIHREDCVTACLPYIKPNGFLIIDNFDSENYDVEKTKELLKDWPCTIYKQPNHSSWITAVFTKLL